MIRAKLWFRCAAMHDPVTPVIVRPAVIGWEAKKRKVDLTIERSFKGDELVMRMKGWVTTDVKEVVEVVTKHGYLKVLDDHDLVVEMETQNDLEDLTTDLEAHFQNQVDLERI
jgi:acyl CoA:acetate/3-ketoacid CoA transferase beta subunit